MPRGDKTGPMGMGPKTGRGLGTCYGFAAPGYANPAHNAAGPGRGQGMGNCGMGRGQHRRFCAAGVPWPGFAAPAADEKTALRTQSGVLEARLRQINQRLAELDSAAE